MEVTISSSDCVQDLIAAKKLVEDMIARKQGPAASSADPAPASSDMFSLFNDDKNDDGPRKEGQSKPSTPKVEMY